MKSILNLLISLTFCYSLNGQTISGKVSDEKQKPAEFASVLLLKHSDSSLVKSALSDSKGEYSFSNISNGRYILAISMIGYKKESKILDVSASLITVPPVILKSEGSLLKEVSVTAKRPFLEQRPDKLVVNVDGSAAAAGSTALEVLQKVPGLIVSNDKITMVGKGSPTILIDGRASQYTDITQVLKDVSAANIDKIEVIGNPGAKYDAAGGAVINIILKRNANLGTNGSISLAGGVGLYSKDESRLDRNFYRLNPSLSLNHRKGIINSFGSYSFFHRNQYDRGTFSRIIDGKQLVQENYSPNDADSHNFRLGADFYTDKKNTFGLIVRGFIRDGLREAGNNTNELNGEGGPLLSTFKTLNNTKSKRNNFSGNVNWKHSFDTLGTDLNIDFDYSNFSIRNNSVITTTEGANNYTNTQLIDNPVQLAVLKLDYSRTFGKNTSLEAGGKSSMATIDNFLTYTKSGIVDPDRTTDFKYLENVNAVYTSLQQKLKKWEVKGGLRAEQTVASGEQRSVKVLDRNYIQLFPSLFITRVITSKFSTIMQYSRRVNRPSFQQQNPFIEYIDSLTYTQGNPTLKPETADQYKLSLTYQSQPFFALSYNKKHDVIFDNAPRQDGKLTYTTTENLGTFDNFAAELNFPLNLGKKISGYGGNQVIFNRYQADYLGGTYLKSKWNWLAYWQIAYKPVSSVNFEVSGYYMTKFLNEFITIDNLGSLNFAVQKTFWDKKAKLSLNINDIFFSDNTSGVLKYREIDLSFRQAYESRNARLTFSYSFGNQKLAAARTRKTASEDEAGRVKDK
ncbi:TonB-dependent receptor [Pedobacter sp. P351]|uniref:TonB-dependent receptor domain-containing protein n=1 Tax=Pedobacter superstes TaxID=3133441 RepID=UPI0030B65808